MLFDAFRMHISTFFKHLILFLITDKAEKPASHEYVVRYRHNILISSLQICFRLCTEGSKNTSFFFVQRLLPN